MNPPELKLLHVENDETEAEICQHFLTKEFGKQGYKLTHVSTIREALELLKKEEFNAILLDLDLDDVQGLDNVRFVKEESPDVPIVVISGHNDNETALHAVRNGAQEYMVKGHNNSRMLGLAVLSSIERKTYERHLFRLANQDELTGLPNRRAFMEYMKQWILRASRWERTETIMFLDVNGFKKVNDILGHDVGDVLLQQVAARLRAGLRASDMVARYAGDEFVIHLDAQAKQSKEINMLVAEKITSLFEPPIHLGGKEIHISVSIGIASYPEHGKDLATLIQSADKAMYQAKQSAVPFIFATE